MRMNPDEYQFGPAASWVSEIYFDPEASLDSQISLSNARFVAVITDFHNEGLSGR